MRIPRPRLPSISPHTTRHYASNNTPNSSRPSRLTRPSPPAPFPTLPHCPPSTCTCAPTPNVGEIDHVSPLNGAITAYHEQILICTGRDDWVSRIEDEDDGDNLAGVLKSEFLGKGGRVSDPFWNVSVLNSSFRSAGLEKDGDTSVYLLPSFKYVPFLRRDDREGIYNMLKGWVLPTKLNPVYETTPEMKPVNSESLLRDENARDEVKGVRDVDEVLVLICGHGGRDERCGVFGPLLKGEFEHKLDKIGGLTVETTAKQVDVSEDDQHGQIPQEEQPVTGARVGLISHIGGHKFAGNVIIYIPPGMKLDDGKKHPLAGLGVWYGRVEPRHVEGIVTETVKKGKVIEELYRGAINRERKIVRIDVGDGLKKNKT